MLNLPPDAVLNGVTIRILERDSIKDFVERNKSYLRGRVLDFACGKQPYRDFIEGEYLAYDMRIYTDLDWRNCHPNSILCTQFLQYIEDPGLLIRKFAHILPEGGHLVLTYTQCWANVPGDDPTYSFQTPHGIETMLGAAGFEILVHEERAKISLGRFDFSLGGGVVGRKI